MRDSLVWSLSDRRESTTRKQLLLFGTTGSPCALPTRTNRAPTPRCLKTAFVMRNASGLLPPRPPLSLPQRSLVTYMHLDAPNTNLSHFSHLTAQLLRAQVKPCGAERSRAPATVGPPRTFMLGEHPKHASDCGDLTGASPELLKRCECKHLQPPSPL